MLKTKTKQVAIQDPVSSKTTAIAPKSSADTKTTPPMDSSVNEFLAQVNELANAIDPDKPITGLQRGKLEKINVVGLPKMLPHSVEGLKVFHEELAKPLSTISAKSYTELVETTSSGIWKKTTVLHSYNANIPAYILFFVNLQNQNYEKAISYLSVIENFDLLEEILPANILLDGKKVELRLDAKVFVDAKAFDGLYEYCTKELVVNGHTYTKSKALKQLLLSKVAVKDKSDTLVKKINEKTEDFNNKVASDTKNNTLSTTYSNYAERVHLALCHFHSLNTQVQSQFPIKSLWALRVYFIVNKVDEDNIASVNFARQVIGEINSAILKKINQDMDMPESKFDSLVYLIEKINLLDDFGKNKDFSIEILLRNIASLEKVQAEVAKLSMRHAKKGFLLEFVAKYAEKAPSDILSQLACYKAAGEYDRNPKETKAVKAVDSLLSSYFPSILPNSKLADEIGLPNLSFKDFDAQVFLNMFLEKDRQIVFNGLSAELSANLKDARCQRLLQQLWKPETNQYFAKYLDLLVDRQEKVIDIIKSLEENANIALYLDQLQLLDRPKEVIDESKRKEATEIIERFEANENIALLKFLISEHYVFLNQIILSHTSKDETFLTSWRNWRKLCANFAPEANKDDCIIAVVKDELSEIRSNASKPTLLDKNKSLVTQYFNKIKKQEKLVFEIADLETLSECPGLSEGLYGQALANFLAVIDSKVGSNKTISNENEKLKPIDIEQYLALLKNYISKAKINTDKIRGIYIEICLCNPKYFGRLSSSDIKDKDCTPARLSRIADYVLAGENVETVKKRLVDYYSLIPSGQHSSFTLFLISAWRKKYDGSKKEQIKLLLNTLFANAKFKENANKPEFLEKFIKSVVPYAGADKLPLWIDGDKSQFVLAQLVEQINKLEKKAELLATLKEEIPQLIIDAYSPSDLEGCKSYADYSLQLFAEDELLSLLKKAVIDFTNASQNKEAYKFLIERILFRLINLFNFEKGEVSQALIKNVKYVAAAPELVKALYDRDSDSAWLLLYITFVDQQLLDSVSLTLSEMPVTATLQMLQAAVLLQKKTVLTAAQITQLNAAINNPEALQLMLEKFSDADLQKMLALLPIKEQELLLAGAMQADNSLLKAQKKQQLVASFISLETVNSEQIKAITNKNAKIKENILSLLSNLESSALIKEEWLPKILAAFEPEELLAHFGIILSSDSVAGGVAVDEKVFIPAKLSSAILVNQTYLGCIIAKAAQQERIKVILEKLLRSGGLLLNTMTSSHWKNLDDTLVDIVNRCDNKENFKLLILSIISLKKVMATRGENIFSAEFLSNLNLRAFQWFLALCVPCLGHTDKKGELDLLQQPFQEAITYFVNSPDKKTWLLTAIEKAFDSKEELLDQKLQMSLKTYFEFLQQNGLNLRSSQVKSKRSGVVVKSLFQEAELKDPFYSLACLLSGNINKSYIETISKNGLMTPFIVGFIISNKDLNDEESINAFIYLINDVILKKINNIDPVDYLTENFLASLGQIADKRLFGCLINFINTVYNNYERDTQRQRKDIKAPKARNKIYAFLISKWQNKNVEVAHNYFRGEASIKPEEHPLASAIIESGREELWKGNDSLKVNDSFLFPYSAGSWGWDNPTAFDIYRLYLVESGHDKVLENLSLTKVNKDNLDSRQQTVIEKLRQLKAATKMKILKFSLERFYRMPTAYFEALADGLPAEDAIKLLKEDDYGSTYTSEQCSILLNRLTEAERTAFFDENIELNANLGVLSAVFSFNSDKGIEEFKQDAVARLAQSSAGIKGSFEHIAPEALDAIADYSELSALRMQEIHKHYAPSDASQPVHTENEIKRKRFVNRLFKNEPQKRGQQPKTKNQFYRFVFGHKGVLQGTDFCMSDVVLQAAKSGMTMQEFSDLLNPGTNVTANDILLFLDNYQSLEANQSKVGAQVVSRYFDKVRDEKREKFQSTGNKVSVDLSYESHQLYTYYFTSNENETVKNAIAEKVLDDPALYYDKYTVRQYLEWLMPSNDKASCATVKTWFENLSENADPKKQTVHKVRCAQGMLAEIILSDPNFAMNHPQAVKIAKTVKSELEYEKNKENNWLYKFAAFFKKRKHTYIPLVQAPVPSVLDEKNTFTISQAEGVDKNCLIIFKPADWFSSKSYVLKDTQGGFTVISKSDYKKYETDSTIYEVDVSKVKGKISIVCGDSNFGLVVTSKGVKSDSSQSAPASIPPSASISPHQLSSNIAIAYNMLPDNTVGSIDTERPQPR